MVAVGLLVSPSHVMGLAAIAAISKAHVTLFLTMGFEQVSGFDRRNMVDCTADAAYFMVNQRCVFTTAFVYTSAVCLRSV